LPATGAPWRSSAIRLATGDEDNFLGTRATSFGVIAAASPAGNFSPHLNAGYAHRGGTVNGPQGITDVGTNAILATAGFDHLIGRNTTLAVEFIVSGRSETTR
jgi:hypothetical protein